MYNDDQHDFDESYMFPLAPPERIMRPNKQRWNLPEGFAPLNVHAYYSLWKGCDEDWERKAQEAVSAQVPSYCDADQRAIKIPGCGNVVMQ